MGTCPFSFKYVHAVIAAAELHEAERKWRSKETGEKKV